MSWYSKRIYIENIRCFVCLSVCRIFENFYKTWGNLWWEFKGLHYGEFLSLKITFFSVIYLIFLNFSGFFWHFITFSGIFLTFFNSVWYFLISSGFFFRFFLTFYDIFWRFMTLFCHFLTLYDLFCQVRTHKYLYQWKCAIQSVSS